MRYIKILSKIFLNLKLGFKYKCYNKATPIRKGVRA